MKIKYLNWLVSIFCGAAVSAGTPASPEPALEEVKKASEILWRSDCSKDSVRESSALKILQNAVDHVTPAEYTAFYTRGTQISPSELKKIYRKKPFLYFYDMSFEKVFRELKEEKVAPGSVSVWLLYNMGIVVKTEKHCFGIDIHHRRAEELVPYMEFALVTHNHSDHSTPAFLAAMNKAGKKVYSNFYASRGGYTKEPETLIEHGDLTIRTYETDHNVYLKKFVMPFEIVCGKEPGACVIFSSGDTCRASQLHPRSGKVDFHLVHPYVGLNVVESATQTVKPEVTLIGHLWEMHHRFDKWRWSYIQGYAAADKIRAAGKKSWVPVWGEKIVWSHSKEDKTISNGKETK